MTQGDTLSKYIESYFSGNVIADTVVIVFPGMRAAA